MIYELRVYQPVAGQLPKLLARDESERGGPIVASISNQILTPTPFSALK